MSVLARTLPACRDAFILMSERNVLDMDSARGVMNNFFVMRTRYLVESLCYKPERRVQIPMRSVNLFLIYLVLPALLWPWGGLNL
jgi:hypothetical protein